MVAKTRQPTLKQGALKIIDFMRVNGVKTLVAVGPSAAMPARHILDLFAKNHPGEEPPKLYCLGRIEDYFQKEKYAPRRAAALIAQTRKTLLRRLNAPVLLFDEMPQTGQTLEGAKKALKHLNARTIYTAGFCVFGTPQQTRGIEPTIVGIRRPYGERFAVGSTIGAVNEFRTRIIDYVRSEEGSERGKKRFKRILRQKRRIWRNALGLK